MGKKTSKYKSLAEWAKTNPADYIAAYRRDMISEICEMFGWELRKTHLISSGFWSVKENVLAEAKKYSSRKEWSKNASGSYDAAKRNRWLDEATIHMVRFSKPNGYWTKENLLTEASKYTTIKDWRTEYKTSYQAACDNGWLDECTTHMVRKYKPAGYWNIKENVLAEAIKYATKGEWVSKSQMSYKAGRENGWFDECTKHMK